MYTSEFAGKMFGSGTNAKMLACLLVQVLDKVVTVVSGQVVVSLTTFFLFYGGFVIFLVYIFIF